MDYTFNKELVKKTLKEKKLTYADFTDMLNDAGLDITQNGIQWWFRSDKNKPEIDKIPIIASVLELDINDLVEQDIFDTKLGVVAIPVVGEASCGLPIMNCYQDDEVIYISESDYKKELYAVIASGDSMSPEISDGDRVVCDPTAEIINGDLVHYQLCGESAIKVYYYDENLAVLRLIPINQAPYFQTKNILKSDVAFDEIKLSKVVHISKDVNNNRTRRLREIGVGR